jgi:hypothetical protein
MHEDNQFGRYGRNLLWIFYHIFQSKGISPPVVIFGSPKYDMTFKIIVEFNM